MPRKSKPKNHSLFRPSQEAFFKLLISKDQEIFWLARRRLGKTRGSLYALMLCAYHFADLIDLGQSFPCKKLDALKGRWQELGRDSRFLYILPFDVQATDVLRPEIEASIAKFHSLFVGLPKWKFQVSDKTFSFKHKGRTFSIRYSGLDKVRDRLRGLGAEIICVDEIADTNPDDIKTILTPMLVDAGGFKYLIGTAKSSAKISGLKREYIEGKTKMFMQTTIDDSIKRGEITRKAFARIVENDYGGNYDNPILLQEFYCNDTLPVSGAILASMPFDIVKLPD